MKLSKTKLLSVCIIDLFIGISIVSGMSFKAEQTFEEPDLMFLFYESGIGDRSDYEIISLWYPNVVRWRPVSIRGEIFDISVINENDYLMLNLFDDEHVMAVIDTVDINVLGTKTIYGGMIDDFFGTFVIAVTEYYCLITIRIPKRNQLFIAQYDKQNNQHYLIELELHLHQGLPGAAPLLPPNEDFMLNEREKQQYESSDDSKSITTIDVMIVYTPAAKDWANTFGGGIDNVVSTAIANGQITLTNSDTFVNWNLIHYTEVNYTESGDSSTDLNRLRSTSDGYMDEVHDWRDQYFADLVQLLTVTSDVGGVGYLLTNKYGSPSYGFSLVRVQQAATGYTSIHEFGHNMGCHHHKEQNTQPGPTNWWNWPENTWSAGWRWVGADQSRYCTVMTYTSGSYFPDGQYHAHVPHFSNPDVYYEGFPTGHAADGDNARTIREIREVIAAYRELNQPPVAGFDVEPSNLVIFETVYFNSTSVDSDGYIVDWEWDMDDGTILSGERVTHEFASNGWFDVMLKVTDDKDAVDTIVKTIFVSNGEDFTDVVQSEFDRGFRMMAGWDAYQEFVPSLDLLSRVELYMTKSGTPTGNVTVEIRKDNAAGILLYQGSISPDDVSTSFPAYIWVNVDVGGVAVNIGHTYVVVLKDAVGAGTHHNLQWGWCDSYPPNSGGPYSGGWFYFRKDFSPSWSFIRDWDYTFRTYGFS